MSKTYNTPYEKEYVFTQFSAPEGGSYQVAPYAYSILLHKIKLELAKEFDYDVSKIPDFDFKNIIDLMCEGSWRSYGSDFNILETFDLAFDFFHSISDICNNIFRVSSEDYFDFNSSGLDLEEYFESQLENCEEIEMTYEISFDVQYDANKIMSLLEEYQNNKRTFFNSHINNEKEASFSLSVLLEPAYYLEVPILSFINFIIFLKQKGVFEIESNH